MCLCMQVEKSDLQQQKTNQSMALESLKSEGTAIRQRTTELESLKAELTVGQKELETKRTNLQELTRRTEDDLKKQQDDLRNKEASLKSAIEDEHVRHFPQCRPSCNATQAEITAEESSTIGGRETESDGANDVSVPGETASGSRTRSV